MSVMPPLVPPPATPPPGGSTPLNPPTAKTETATTTTVVTSTGPSTSAWDHFSLVLATLILTGSGILDTFHPLSASAWGAVGVSAAALGVKGIGGVLPRSSP